MKYTILGFSQKHLVDMEIDIDEALILRCFVDFKDSNAMVKEIIEADVYYWINYEFLRKELAILNISKDRVYRKLKHLVELGILKHKTKKEGGTYSFYAIGPQYGFLISDSAEMPKGTVKTPEGYGKNTGEGTVKTPEGYGENNGPKYPSIKYPSTNNPSIKDIYTPVITEVVNYLNSVCGTNFQPSTKETIKYIKSKMKEGYNFDQFKKVIDVKAKEWMGTEWQVYLRPKTLFGDKFEGYLNQPVVINKTTQGNQSKPSNWDYDGQRQYDYDDLEKKLLAKSFDSPEGVDG